MDMELPDKFPALPNHIHPNHNILTAYQFIQKAYNHAYCVLTQEEGDPLRLQFHFNRLQERAFPLLAALPNDEHGLPMEWITESAHILGRLSQELHHAANGVETEYVLI